jgi:hypothetical protein
MSAFHSACRLLLYLSTQDEMKRIPTVMAAL